MHKYTLRVRIETSRDLNQREIRNIVKSIQIKEKHITNVVVPLIKKEK